jgi:hypothetical protein
MKLGGAIPIIFTKYKSSNRKILNCSSSSGGSSSSSSSSSQANAQVQGDLQELSLSESTVEALLTGEVDFDVEDLDISAAELLLQPKTSATVPTDSLEENPYTPEDALR